MRPTFRFCLALTTFVFLPLEAPARPIEVDQAQPWCGSGDGLLRRFEAEHAYHASQPRRLKATDASLAVDQGEIAVIEDDGTIITPANGLDLSNRTLTFRPNGAGFSLSAAATGLAGTPGSRLIIGDDATVERALAFAFPLGGRTFNSVFINSDGNLTFGAGDGASTSRTLGRFLSLPRVGPLFQDLDPSSGGRVLVESTAQAFTVTWDQVPQFGLSAPNSFQARIQPDGAIILSYGSLGTRDAVVGVAPVANSAPVKTDLTGGSGNSGAGQALVEVFAVLQSFDDLSATQAFFRTHSDIFDFLVVFNDFGQAASSGFAFHLGVKNEVEGLNIPLFDGTATVGSRGRLQSYMGMGPVSQYPIDPNTSFLGTNTTLDIFGQESGHRWLARLRFDDRGRPSDKLLGRESAPGAGVLSHWNFCMDSDGSDIEGNDWRDNGNGTFTTVDATSRFSLLDQYAMGLVPAEMVPPTFVLDFCNDSQNSSDARSRARPPEIGVTVTAGKRDVTIQEIIRAEGARRPAAAQAPKSFNMAVALVVRNGQQPASGTLQKIDRFRRAWTEYFRRATDNRGTFVATLDGGPEDTETPGGDDDDGGGCGILRPGQRPPSGGSGRALGSALLGLLVALGLATSARGRQRAPG